ncbi:MAG: nucleotidyltransferase [Elusimicrobiota bacterium]|jgi:hypothetical protein
MFDFTSRAGQTDELLAGICEELQLSPTQHTLAEQRYRAIGKWLADSTFFRLANPQIYPQGSLSLGTTVKPLGCEEYDLDLVLEFALKREQFQNPVDLLNAVESRLRENDTYRPMVSRKNRCIRVTYANDFYLDILPAIPDPSLGGTCLLVPDREARTWKASNPRGYSAWFASRTALRKFAEMRNNIEPLPDHEAADEKEALKLVVQLIKRNRDIVFKSETAGPAPISIVLTTLAAHFYSGHNSISESLTSIFADIVSQLPISGRLRVMNPQNPKEDFSEKWDQDAVGYPAFVAWLKSFQRQWSELHNKTGVHEVGVVLNQLFGETVAQNALKKQAVRIQNSRSKGALRVGGLGTLSSVASAAPRSISPNTFYGD